jgi:hypothetical protein
MRKLKLESLQVESFETTGTGPMSRGTVEGNAASDEFTECCDGTEISWCSECIDSIDFPCEPTYDGGTGCTATNCGGDCSYFGCSFGCTVDTACC